MRILIAEDDPASRLILLRTLERLGHQCLYSDDGRRALELYAEWQPDVIISDWMMPGLDGLSLCRAVREKDENRYTYFIVLTALSNQENFVTGLRAGADDYIVKPIDAGSLEARLIAARRVTSLHRTLIDQKLQLERMNAELFEDGRRDSLTRVGNRLRLEEDLLALGHRAVRYGQGFGVGLCDVDHFKRYNDSCGHHAGDEALRVVARCLATHGRVGDFTYRYGGEEFVVLLPAQNSVQAYAAMERRRMQIERLQVPHPGFTPPRVLTVSIGVATFRLDASDAQPHHVQSALTDVVERADRALYRAKEAGRNRVETDEPLPEGEVATEREGWSG